MKLFWFPLFQETRLTVVRGFGGTTAADIADETVITIDSTSREENSLAENDGIFQPEKNGKLFPDYGYRC